MKHKLTISLISIFTKFCNSGLLFIICVPRIKFLDNINRFATVKHIVKKNDENHLKVLDIFDDIKKDLKTYGLELRIQELESKFAEDFNQTTFDEIRKLKKEQNIN